MQFKDACVLYKRTIIINKREYDLINTYKIIKFKFNSI